MATLLDGASSNGAGTGVSHSGPCAVAVEGDSVFNGASVRVEWARVNTAAKFVPVDPNRTFYGPGGIAIGIEGTYFLRAVVADAGAGTSINCFSNQ